MVAKLKKEITGNVLNYQLFITKHLKRKSVLSFLLYPLSIFFTIIVVLRRFLYTKIPILTYKSKFKIISVGNITSGGTGKTPFTIFLANHLIEKKKQIAIVLRGYKGKYENTTTLITSTNETYVSDEVSLYTAKLSNVPICVGKNRIKSLKLLQEKYPSLDYVIMDDAFQHLKVYQDTKICIFHTQNPIGNGFCLPAGILREPISALKYVDYLVFNGNKNDLSQSMLKRFESFGKPIFEGEYVLKEIKDFSGKLYDIETIKTSKNMLLSGIGSPKSFEDSISKFGISFEYHLFQNDHFEYTEAFLEQNQIDFEKYDYILTTEKDYSKLKGIRTNLPFLVVCVNWTP